MVIFLVSQKYEQFLMILLTLFGGEKYIYELVNLKCVKECVGIFFAKYKLMEQTFGLQWLINSKFRP